MANPKDKKFGTMPCPQAGCAESAIVWEGPLDASGKRAFRSECTNLPAAHEHTFGDYMIPQISLLPKAVTP